MDSLHGATASAASNADDFSLKPMRDARSDVSTSSWELQSAHRHSPSGPLGPDYDSRWRRYKIRLARGDTTKPKDFLMAKAFEAVT